MFSSCIKEDKAYPLPEQPAPTGDFPVQNAQVNIGEDYATQVYFSLTTGLVNSNHYDIWDISFTTDPGHNELWLNGGNSLKLYPTGNDNYAAVLQAGNITALQWLYDDPGGLNGTSALGALDGHLGEVLILSVKKGTAAAVLYKLQVTEVTGDHYKIVAGPLAAATGTEYTLNRDVTYNYVFFSFTGGIVTVEPPKTQWDIVFTRYQHVYRKYNPDNSDFPYPVNGVLSNPYQTTSADDSTKAYDFYAFDTLKAETFDMVPNRDVIGFDWKTVNINTGKYTMNPNQIFLVKDQEQRLWKLRFVSFYNEQGIRGYPQFEYQRLR